MDVVVLGGQCSTTHAPKLADMEMNKRLHCHVANVCLARVMENRC